MQHGSLKTPRLRFGRGNARMLRAIHHIARRLRAFKQQNLVAAPHKAGRDGEFFCIRRVGFTADAHLASEAVERAVFFQQVFQRHALGRNGQRGKVAAGVGSAVAMVGVGEQRYIGVIMDKTRKRRCGIRTALRRVLITKAAPSLVCHAHTHHSGRLLDNSISNTLYVDNSVNPTENSPFLVYRPMMAVKPTNCP